MGMKPITGPELLSSPRRKPTRGLWRNWLLILAMWWAGQAAAAGFALHEHSLTAMGTAYAGAGVNAGDEAAGLFWNPAGIVRAPSWQLQAGAVYVNTSSPFENQGSSQSFQSADGTLSLPTTGPSDDGGTAGVIPSAYLVADLRDRVRLGLGIYAPFGLSTEYRPDWVGRYHAIKSAITTVSVNPVVSYRLTDRLTLGAGVSASYLSAELSQAVFVLDPGSGAQLPDGRATLEADDWGYGVNAGLLYSAGDDSRLGIAYRSHVDQQLTGHRSLSGVGAFSGRTDVSAGLTLPESLIVSGYRPITRSWAVMADAMWTRWSRLDELRVKAQDGFPDDVTRFDWTDSWRLAVGILFEPSEDWKLRFGLAYDQAPIPSPERRTPRLPDNDRYWITFGASYRPTANLTLDFGYAFVQLSRADVASTVDLAAAVLPGAYTDTLRGAFETDSHLVGVQLRIAL
jgi:long-chain fatty acid transport protein